ncbi:MAG: T9SS C-terminal target domain-containing protein [Ignavibacteriales bacterium]|nr:MAG: T9SS C-terminal target domain-containing protein [Ignavibacteriales bacterium]
MKIKSLLIRSCFVPFVLLLAGWGEIGHQTINSNMFKYLPAEMDDFSNWKNYMINNAGDADDRKDDDPGEAARHSINLDQYYEFLAYGHITQDLDSLIQLYSAEYVYDEGILPWAIIQCYDSLTNCLIRREWKNAKQIATDLAHYVGDAHMPYHLKKDYDIYEELHQRFENDLIDEYAGQVSFEIKTAVYINDVRNFIFNTLYNNYPYTDSILLADKVAQNISGSSSSDLYYSALWNHSKSFSNHLFSNASYVLASLIYTAWANAGKPEYNTTSVEEDTSTPLGFKLEQNYPNPFNPTTKIKFTLPNVETSYMTSLRIYNILGKEIITLINKELSPGNYEVEFNAQEYVSGLYFYELRVGDFIITKKMLVIK